MKVQKIDIDTRHIHTDIVQDITDRNMNIVMGKIFDNLYTQIERTNNLIMRVYN